jgi:hypothetical protein
VIIIMIVCAPLFSHSPLQLFGVDADGVVLKISLATSTRASNTKTLRKKPATLSTLAGTPPGPSTVSSLRSPISAKPVAD